MITAIGAFLAGIFLSWPALIALILLSVLFEYHERHGWTVFLGLITLVVCYFFFSVPLTTLAIGAVGYIAFGLVWSVWRYKRYADKRVVEIRQISDVYSRDAAMRNLDPKQMLGTIVQWILIWPFSLVENMIRDFITLIESLVTKVFKAVYQKIYTSAIEKILER